MNAFDVEKIATKIKANVQGQTEPETRQIIDERELTIQLDVGYYIDYSVTPGVLKVMDNVFDGEGNPENIYNRCPNNILKFVADYKDKYGKYPDANVSITRYEEDARHDWIPQASYQGKLDVRYIDNNDYAVENIKDAIQDGFFNSDYQTVAVNLNNTYKVHADEQEDLFTYKSVMQCKYDGEERHGYFIIQNEPYDRQSGLVLKDGDSIKFGEEHRFIFGFFPFDEETPETSINFQEWERNGGFWGTGILTDSHSSTEQFNQVQLTFNEVKSVRKSKSAKFEQAIWVKGESITSRGFSEISAHTEMNVAKEMDVETDTEAGAVTLTETMRKFLFGLKLTTNVNGGLRAVVDKNEGMGMSMHLSRFEDKTKFTKDSGVGHDATYTAGDRTITQFFSESLNSDELTREKMYLDPALKLPEIE